MGADQWDERYQGEGEHRIWSGEPNQALVAEVSDMEPGRALDLGCGEGADAIWLAKRGWQVTGMDISGVALDRAREAASAAGVTVDWVNVDFVAEPPLEDAYDLVISFYPALLKTAGRAAVDALSGGVAPGGTLLFVWHADFDPERARRHGIEPDDFLYAADIAPLLGDDWTIEVNEVRGRDTPSVGQSPHADDSVLRARRS